MSTFQQFIFSPWLTPVRVVATANLAGTYNNGPLNNGVGATLTVAASSLTVDSVVTVVGDRVLLAGQTTDAQNGIYVVLSIGSTVVLQRAADFQSIEQMKAGQYVTVGAGTIEAGSAFVLTEPLPAHLGLNDLTFTAVFLIGAGTAAAKAASDNGQPTLASVVGATVANALAVFADAAGSVKAQTTTATLGFGLTAATGNITVGSSGNAGTFISFPATAANGTFIISAANAGGAFNTTLRNGTMAQSTVYTIGDIGAATGAIPVASAATRMKWVAAAASPGGAAAQVIVDAFCTTTSAVIGNWNTQTNAAAVQKIVPGNGSFTVTSSADAGVGTFEYLIMK